MHKKCIRHAKQRAAQWKEASEPQQCGWLVEALLADKEGRRRECRRRSAGQQPSAASSPGRIGTQLAWQKRATASRISLLGWAAGERAPLWPCRPSGGCSAHWCCSAGGSGGLGREVHCLLARTVDPPAPRPREMPKCEAHTRGLPVQSSHRAGSGKIRLEINPGSRRERGAQPNWRWKDASRSKKEDPSRPKSGCRCPPCEPAPSPPGHPQSAAASLEARSPNQPQQAQGGSQPGGVEGRPPAQTRAVCKRFFACRRELSDGGRRGAR